MINYDFKSYVLREHEDLINKVKLASKQSYAEYLFCDLGIITYSLKNWNKDAGTLLEMRRRFNEYKLPQAKEIFKECERINDAEYHRTKRLRKRIESFLTSGRCLFLTLTFTPEAISNTTEKQRRIAVTRFLKKTGQKYVANIDFGVDPRYTMREHYHAVITGDYVDGTEWREKYGAMFAEHIRYKHSIKLSKYVAKLSNHAIKEQARRSTLIYSR